MGLEPGLKGPHANPARSTKGIVRGVASKAATRRADEAWCALLATTIYMNKELYTYIHIRVATSAYTLYMYIYIYNVISLPQEAISTRTKPKQKKLAQMKTPRS